MQSGPNARIPNLEPLNNVVHANLHLLSIRDGHRGKWRHTGEDLVRYAWPQGVWFHVAKLSSAYVYARLLDASAPAPTMSSSSPSKSDAKTRTGSKAPPPLYATFAWTDIPEALLVDCAQLVKVNSTEGVQYSVSHLSFLLSYFLVFELVSVVVVDRFAILCFSSEADITITWSV